MSQDNLSRRDCLRAAAMPGVTMAATMSWGESGPLPEAEPLANNLAGERLKGCRAAMIIASGYHEHEFWFPYYRLKEEGVDVMVAGPEAGMVYGEGRHGKDGLPATITHPVKAILEQPFDLIYLPGGLWSPMELRAHQPTLDLVRQALLSNVLVAAICHAPWILVSAGVVKGRKIACPPDMAVDVTNAGGICVPDPCVQDGNLITAVYYGYLPDHFRLLMPALAARCQKKRRPL